LKFDSTFELMLISKFLQSKSFAQKATRLLRPENFSKKSYSNIFKIALDYFNTYGKLPNLSAYKLELKQSDLKKEAKKKYLILIKKLLKIKTFDNNEYALDRTKEFVEENNYIIALKKATDIYSTSFDIKKSKDILTDEILKSYDFNNYKISNYLDGWKERQRIRKYLNEHPDERLEIPTGFPAFDKKTGGVKNGQLFSIIATTGKGKTTFLLNIIYNAVIKGYSVLSIFPENTMEEIEQKLDSRFTEIFYRSLTKCDFTKDELKKANRRFELLEKNRKDHIRIATVIPETCDINTVRTIYNEGKLDKFEPQLLVFDGADLMKPLRHFKEYRFEQQAVFWDIKRFILEKMIACWVSAQAKPQYADATKKANSEAFREAYAKATICDGITSLNVSEQQYKDHEADWWIAKMREAPDNYGVKLSVQRSMMKMTEMEE